MTVPNPTTLGRYEVVRQLGKGSMGVVYLARDPLIGRLVAIKTFRPGGAADDTEARPQRSRFLREAQSAGILSHHPGIVTIHDVVHQSDGSSFIAMEYVEGEDLKKIIASGRPLTLGFVVDVVRQVADALDFAHANGVIHRDVKPANVIITPDGRVKITDFGIARVDTSNLTQDGEMLGTPNYMAPEQVQGVAVDHRADIFSLGVIAYELLTHQKPFPGDSLTVVTHRIVHDDFIPLDRHVSGLSAGITRALHRALEKDPARRYRRAGDFASDLAAAAGIAAGDEVSDTQALPPDGLVAPSPPVGGDAGRAAAAGSPPVSPPAPRAGAGPSPRRRLTPAVARIAAAVAIAVALGLAAGALLLYRAGAWGSAAPVSAAAPPLAAELADLLRRGHRHLAAGEPREALTALRRAEELAPERSRIQALRRIAEHQASARGVVDRQARDTTERLAAARQALAAGRPGEALGAAEGVLASEPGNEAAAAIADAARAALEQRRRAESAAERRRAAEATTPTPSPETVNEAVAAGAGRPGGGAEAEALPAPASLTIEFIADRPEGTLVIVADGERIVDEPFRFYDRVGLFKKKPYRGRITVPARRVAPGQMNFRIWVALAGEPARFTEVSGNFPPGVARRLDIHLAPDGSVSARLE